MGWRGSAGSGKVYPTTEGFLPKTTSQRRRGVVAVSIWIVGGRREVEGASGVEFANVLPIWLASVVMSSI
jgi:hypothetical protein